MSEDRALCIIYADPLSLSRPRRRTLYAVRTTASVAQNTPVDVSLVFRVLPLSPGQLPIHWSATGLGSDMGTYGWLGSRVVSVLTQVQKGPGSNRSRDAVG